MTAGSLARGPLAQSAPSNQRSAAARPEGPNIIQHMAKAPRTPQREPRKAADTPGATTWIRRMKFRALAWLCAIVLATIATIVLAGAPAWPVVGVAVFTACMSVGKITAKLLKPRCWECGHDLAGQPVGGQGIACPKCGSVSSPGLVQLAQMGDPQGEDDSSRAG